MLGRLVAARGRVLPVAVLVDDLWDDPPEGAVAAVRTFVAALRRALEPDRPPRAPARLLVTAGSGYALRLEPGAVDAERFERAVAAARDGAPAAAVTSLTAALGEWRGPAYADAGDWARAERGRLAEPALHGGRAGWPVRGSTSAQRPRPYPTSTHTSASTPGARRAGRCSPSRCTGATGRATRSRCCGAPGHGSPTSLGVEPGPRLATLETDVLRRAAHLDPPRGAAAGVWAAASASLDRVRSSPRARLESTVGLLGSLALSGADGLRAVREQRVAAILAAEEPRRPGAHRPRARRPRRARVLAAVGRRRARRAGGGGRAAHVGRPRTRRLPRRPLPAARRAGHRDPRAARPRGPGRRGRGRAAGPRPRRPGAAGRRPRRAHPARVRTPRPRRRPRRPRRRAW
nr:helix-turn-helix domain-containing protein [Angustibacter aerolatus]